VFELMNKIGAKTDCVVLAVVNMIAWLVEIDAALKSFLTLLSILFVSHRYWHWYRTKDAKDNPAK
jgi:hypothetical protein